LLFVVSQTSFLAFGDAVAVGFSVAASAGVEGPGVIYNRPVLAIASVSDNVGRVRLTMKKSPFGYRVAR